MARLITCEGCNTQVEQAHSMLVVLQKVTPQGYTYYQCDNGSLVDGHNWQHWHCSHEHMVPGVKSCMVSHYKEEKLHPIESGSTNIHKQVLTYGLYCVICGTSLKSVAYRYCLTMATPHNYVPHSHHNLIGWCCSLDHATDSALDILDAMPHVTQHNNGEEDKL